MTTERKNSEFVHEEAPMYYIQEGFKAIGPYDFETIRQMVASGRIGARDLLFEKGGRNWIVAESMPRVRKLFGR